MRNKKFSPMNKLLALSFLSFATIFSVTNTNLAKSKGAVETHAAQDLTTLYSSCESAVASKSLSNLWSSVKTAANSGYKSGSYDTLWTWYWTTDKKDDGTLMDYYSNTTNWTSTSGQCGSYQGEGGCYNREHSIPKSWWGGSKSNQGCDIYIVVPTDGYVNSKRSAFAFGEVGSATYTSNGGYSKLGTSSRSDYSGTVFEPNDQWKGDFARIYFYARAKWNSVSMTTSEGSKVFSGSDSTNYGLTSYAKKLFYEWHKADPVDAWELQRNSRAESVQGNRNPFIDHPEYADYLWGGVEIGTGGTTTTAPENLTISGTSTISVGGTSQLSVSTTTSGASTSVTWSTSNSAVATVSTTGVVTGVKAGTATITATSTVDTSISATFSVTVKGLSSLSTSGTPAKTSYTTADNFDPTGLTVTANYSDGSTSNVTNDVTWSKPSTNGTVTGTYGGLSVTVSGLTVTQATTTTGTATYTISSPTAVTSSGAPSGSSATYSQTYKATAGQMTSGDSATLTLSGYDNCVITGITLSMKSNSSKGAGSFTAVAGTTTISSIADSKFNTTNWNGAWSTTYVNVSPAMISSSYPIQSGENVTLTITASANSLYIESYTIAYTQNISSGGGDVSEPDSVTLDPTSHTMNVGESVTLNATANGTVTWSSSDPTVASVNNGTVTALKAGTATITATVGTASATCSITVNESGSTPVVSENSIKKCYGLKNGDAVSFTVYGLYVGSVNNGQSSIIMNGQYGIMLYRLAPDASWVENETYLAVTSAKINVYNKLYQLVGNTKLSATKVTDQATIESEIEPVVTYTVTGNESSSDLTIANRLSTVTGTVTEITTKNGTGYTESVDNTVTMTVNGNSVTLFVKSGSATAEVGTALNKSLSDSTEITIQCFTSFFTSFQLMFKSVVPEDPTYTAEQFASDLLSLTNEACTTSQNNNWSDVSSTLAPIWVKLEGAEYYGKLKTAERATLLNAAANEAGTTIEQAMNRYDHIVARYGLTNFISRTVISKMNITNFLTNENSLIPIITIISLSAITLIGASLILRKKEN